MIALTNPEIEVVHGSESFRCAELAGATIAVVRAALEVILSIPVNAGAWLNGHLAQPGDVLSLGDLLEFRVCWGQKGRDELLTPEEFMEQTGLGANEYEYLVGQGMPRCELPAGLRLVMGEIRVWLRDQNGLFMEAARKAVARARLRIDERGGAVILDGHPYPVTADQAAILKVLLDRLGDRLSAREICDARDDLQNVRIGRRLIGLPTPLAALIDTRSQGSLLRLE